MRQNHRLGGLFLTRLLQRALRDNRDREPGLSPLEVDLWDVSAATVQRERFGIDVLAAVEAHRFVLVVENKIDAVEHSDQLGRYLRAAEREYPGWRHLALYLTPDGAEPSTSTYIPMGYASVCEVVEAVLTDAPSGTERGVLLVLSHYAQMLRRHIVAESEIADLCRRIYRRHQRALDLIFEHRPDQQAEIRDALVERIARTPGLVLDRAGKGSVDFAPEEWDRTVLTGGAGWTASGRMLMFEFRNDPRRLKLTLYLGPGPQEVRQRLFERFQRAPYRPNVRQLRAKWNGVWERILLRAEQYDDAETADLIRELDDRWREFVERDLPGLTGALLEETWLWTGGTDAAASGQGA